MKKLLITAMLAAVCGGVNAQVVNPDSIIDGNKYAKTEEWPEDGRMPQFRNGTEDLFRWLSFYVRYPKEAKKHKVEGRGPCSRWFTLLTRRKRLRPLV